jgi:hypothetical protein
MRYEIAAWIQYRENFQWFTKFHYKFDLTFHCFFELRRTNEAARHHRRLASIPQFFVMSAARRSSDRPRTHGAWPAPPAKAPLVR